MTLIPRSTQAEAPISFPDLCEVRTLSRIDINVPLRQLLPSKSKLSVENGFNGVI